MYTKDTSCTGLFDTSTWNISTKFQHNLGNSFRDDVENSVNTQNFFFKEETNHSATWSPNVPL
mgnify:CR=1 FL=1